MPAQNLDRKNKEGIYSHVYNKGIENRTIFRDEADFHVFLGFLEEYLSAPKDAASIKKEFSIHGRTFKGVPHQPKNYLGNVELLAYNIQPDHFHLLLHQKTQNSLQGFIRSLCTRYSMYFNKKYKHTGALFQGPYKSAQIKDEDLSLLTRYLHKTGDYSTYAEYLGLKDTSWVNTKTVLSIKNGDGNYQDFVEKYVPDQDEMEQLGKMIIEKIDSHLERRDLARNIKDYSPEIPAESPENIPTEMNLRPLQRIPEIAVITIVFLVLVTVGIRNINASPHKVLGSSASPKITLTPSPVVEEEKKAKTMLVITINDATSSASVNIRKKPTTSSEKIGQAKDGDTFEFVSVDSGWYGVKLADGQVGFISEKYIETNQAHNE